MRKSIIGALAIAGMLGFATLASAADEPAKPAAPDMKSGMMQDHMKRGMPMHGGMHGHKRSCFDSAWQSDEWKRCESMMEQRQKKS